MTPLLALLVTQWPIWFDGYNPHEIHLMKIGGNRGLRSNLVVLGFVDRDSVPSIVIKIVRNSQDSRRLEREYDQLELIRRKLQGSLASSLPRPLFCGQVDGQAIFMQSALPGKLMGNLRAPWHFSDDARTRKRTERDLTMAFDWLIAFADATRVNSEESGWAVNLLQSCESVTYLLGKDTLNFQTRRALLDLQERLSRAKWTQETLPICVHGDFWAGNILLLDENKLGVVDWEHASLAGIPGIDAAFYCLSYSLGFGQRKLVENYHFAFREKNWFSEMVRHYLSEYCKAVNLDLEALDQLFGLVLASRAWQETSPGTSSCFIYRQILDEWAEHPPSLSS